MLQDIKIYDNEEGYTTELITSYGVDFIKNNNSGKTGKTILFYLYQESFHAPIQGLNDQPVRYEGSGNMMQKMSKEQEPIV